uniref:Putative tick ixodegrin n=1 Tax=Amblyomma americanum TaxID=6943 RepID=A0A0C9SDF5_AMBAM
MPRYLLLICVALLPVVSAQQAGADNEDLYQKPIQMPDVFGVDDTRNKTTPPKPKVKRLGQPCKSSDECLPGLCCLQRRWRGPRICRPQAGRYRRCSDDQVKGGYYMGHCPCLMGEHTCEKGFCIP